MEAKRTPLIELLERVPQDARVVVEHDQFSSSSHPVGRLCHEAAAELRRLHAQAAQDEALLRQALEALEAENKRLREVLKDADNELDWLDEDVGTCDHSVGVCVCDYRDMRRKMKAALASQRGNADIALLVFAVVCAVWLVIAGAMGWLPGGGL